MDEEALIASRLLTKTTSISKAPPPLRALAGKLAALVAAAGKVRQGCDRAGAGVLQSAAREAGALQSDARGVAFARGEIQGRERTGRARPARCCGPRLRSSSHGARMCGLGAHGATCCH